MQEGFGLAETVGKLGLAGLGTRIGAERHSEPGGSQPIAH